MGSYPGPVAPQQTTRTYTGRPAYEAGVNRMQRDGWRLVTTATNQPRSGCLRFIMLGGIGALVFKKKQEYTATFAR